MDFIVALPPTTDGTNMILTIVDKASKAQKKETNRDQAHPSPNNRHIPQDPDDVNEQLLDKMPGRVHVRHSRDYTTEDREHFSVEYLNSLK